MTQETPSTEVWKKVKCLSSNPTTHKIVLKENDSVITDTLEVANKLAEDFANRAINI